MIEFVNVQESPDERYVAQLEAEVERLRVLLREAQQYVVQCNHIEAHDDTRRLLVNIAAALSVSS